MRCKIHLHLKVNVGSTELVSVMDVYDVEAAMNCWLIKAQLVRGRSELEMTRWHQDRIMTLVHTD